MRESKFFSALIYSLDSFDTWMVFVFLYCSHYHSIYGHIFIYFFKGWINTHPICYVDEILVKKFCNFLVIFIGSYRFQSALFFHSLDSCLRKVVSPFSKIVYHFLSTWLGWTYNMYALHWCLLSQQGSSVLGIFLYPLLS